MQQPTSPVVDVSTDCAAILAAGAALATVRVNPAPDGLPFALVPKGYELMPLDIGFERDLPARAKGLVKLRDAGSFIRWINDHRQSESRVYATMDPASFLFVVDDFMPVEVGSEARNWREFRAEFTAPPSREWKLWNAANRKHMSQLAFAEFLQDNLPDVIEPDGATLLEVALNFEATQSGNFVSAQRLSDGSSSLVWKSENSGGTVRLPEAIKLSIPVFENEEPRELTARLRHRAKDGQLVIWYELVRPHKVLEAAFRETWVRIEEQANAVILLGSPE